MIAPQKTLKGSALGFSVLILTLLLFSGISLLSVSVLEKKAIFATQKSIISFQGADSGAERVLKRIYIDNSPPLAVVPLNGAMTGDGTLTTLASNLGNVSGASCQNGVVSATNTNAPPSASPNYTFSVAFYDKDNAVIPCADAQWRDKLAFIRSEGFYQRTSRVIEVGIRPRE